MRHGKQLVAARALLGWTQDELSQKSDVAKPTIIRFENNEANPNTTTIKKITSAINKGGVVFTDKGVEYTDNRITILETDTWYLELLDDVLYTLEGHKKNKVLRTLFADDRKSSQEGIEALRRLKRAGIEMRTTCEKGNSFLLGEASSYRWIEPKYYTNWLTLIYGNKVAVSINNEKGCTIFDDANFANACRLQFDLTWNFLEEPERSTADVRL